MTTLRCASCFKQFCVGGEYREKESCATYAFPDVFDEAREIYAQDSETGRLAKHAAIVESKGYMVWPRLKDTIELARRMKFNKIAVLFCPDVGREAKKTCRILTESGFTVISRVCGIQKSKPQLPGEVMAELNGHTPEMIVNAGLCVGCEAETLRLSMVPVTTFIARDKKLNNYPASAVYASDKWKDWAKEIYRDKVGLK